VSSFALEVGLTTNAKLQTLAMNHTTYE